MFSYNQYNNNVDLISVAAFASTTPTGEYNQIDTPGSGAWGGTGFQQTPAGQSAATFPVLTGDKYYLPIKKSPYGVRKTTAKRNGVGFGRLW